MGRNRDDGRTRHQIDSGLAELVPDPDRPGGVTLLVDGAAQSYVDLADPAYLEFDYMRRIAYVLDVLAPAGPLRVLHLGGGALSLPRYLAATRPGSAQQVVEADARLVDLVRERLPLPRVDRPRIRVGDARAVLAAAPAGTFDVVIGDVFAGARIPSHLTTVEYAAAVARVLRPTGSYLANVADGAGLAFARGQVATLRAVFAEVCVLADAPVLRGRRFGNLLLVAAGGPLPAAALVRRAAGDPFPARVLHGERAAAFAGGTRPVSDSTAGVSPVPPRGGIVPSGV